MDSLQLSESFCDARMKPQSYRHVVPRAGRYDVYVTCVASSPISDGVALGEFFDEVAAAAGGDGMKVLQGKIYGLCARRGAILQAAQSAFEHRGLDPDFPTTFLEGAPCGGGVLAGAQIVGTIPAAHMERRVEVDTIRHQGTVVGRSMRAAGYRMVFLSGITGGDSSHESAAVQAQQMFRNAAALLQRQDLSPRHIIRTWIYLPHLLRWYGEFNRVRTACFRELGIIDDHGKGLLPASTGIQGERADGEECFMDLLAIESMSGSAPVAIPMRNVRQNEASEYGSSFSRGMAVYTDAPPTLYVSGTASIDPSGRTVYHGDPQGQIVETLLNVAALLDVHAATLRDIRQATAYCKDERTYRVFERVVSLLGLTGVPFVPVIADVCRDELLFEIDCIAVAAAPESVETVG
jgi:enamine deaminase RidA (YjgF/YER057c/UK114 family)